ncbi:unnamed protein product [Heterobilharzia americana]|nr:unnamed protein product [Heterobilharzia americana]CAH8482960.1 unnamed protein product [Heterobilharzia americana]
MKCHRKLTDIFNSNNEVDSLKKNKHLRKPVICGTCGRKDTTPQHPILCGPVISCEYSYGCHNKKDGVKWLDQAAEEKATKQTDNYSLK